jgi:hypothetical protein
VKVAIKEQLPKNRLSMYLAVRDFLIPNSEITKGLPNFETYFSELQKTISDIQAIAEVQKSDTKGYAKHKLQLREKLITLVLDASHKLNAFARFSGDLKLQSEVKINRSKLNKAADTGLRDYAQIIHDKAAGNLEALANYGINAETQNELLNTINDYNASISGPRVARTETAQATKQLTVLFEKADLMLENIDAAIGILKISQPGFYNGFRIARKIVITGAGSLALRGYAVESANGTAIRGVKFSFKPDNPNLMGPDNPPEIVRKTADKGIFLIKNMPQGTYTVTVSKPGYKEKVVSVVVASGEMTELKVEMDKV